MSEHYVALLDKAFPNKKTKDNYKSRLKTLIKTFEPTPFNDVLDAPDTYYPVLQKAYPSFTTRKNMLTLVLVLFREDPKLKAKTETAARWRKLHDDLFHAVVNGVTSFFDVVPCGHVISRLSTDTDVLDDQLPEFMEQTISLWLVILSIILVVSTQYPWFVLPLLALMVMFLFMNEFFRRSSREMQVRLRIVTHDFLNVV